MVRDEADERDEVWRGHVLVQLLLDVHPDVWRKDLHEGLGSQLSHRVVLDRTARKICINKAGQPDCTQFISYMRDIVI